MTHRTWGPFSELDALRREIDQAFEGYGAWQKPYSRFSFVPALAARSYPLVNVGEDRDNVYVEALAPGLDTESLEISVQEGQLRIAGEKKSITPDVKTEAYHRNERSAGRFVRTMTLPADVNVSAVKAQYKNGLLLITLPKAEEAKPKQIRVEIG